MDSQDIKIRKGQAYNLAVQAAIAAGKATDTKTIFSYYVYYFETASLVQVSKVEDIKKLFNE